MISIFRQKSPGNIIVLLFFGLLLKLPLFLWPKTVVATANDANFYHEFIRWATSLTGNNSLLCSLAAFLLLYGQSLMVNYLVNEYRLLPKSTYLPAMAYLLLTSLLPEWSYLSSPLIATTFILWAFSKLLSLYNTPVARGPVFNIGLLIGISSLFYFPAACFLLCALLGLVILKPFRLHEVVLFLVGCLTPYYFMVTVLFLTDRLHLNAFFPNLSFQLPVVKSTLPLAISILLLAVPFLTGGYFVQAHLHKMLIQVRKAWSILLFYLLLAFFVPFVNSNSSFNNWVLLVVPFACFHAGTYFFSAKRWITNALFLLTAGWVLYLQYGTTLWR